MMTPTPTPPPDDLAAQLRQCAADLASRNLLVSEAARGRAPGVLVGAAAEMERLKAEAAHLKDGWGDALGIAKDFARENERLTQERDAYLSLLVQQTGVLGRWTARCVMGQIAARHGGLWWKDGVYQFPSYESAVAAVRAAASLPIAPAAGAEATGGERAGAREGGES
jgi:hypothetical protein